MTELICAALTYYTMALYKSCLLLLGRVALGAQWPIVIKLSRGRSVGLCVGRSVGASVCGKTGLTFAATLPSSQITFGRLVNYAILYHVASDQGSKTLRFSSTKMNYDITIYFPIHISINRAYPHQSFADRLTLYATSYMSKPGSGMCAYSVSVTCRICDLIFH